MNENESSDYPSTICLSYPCTIFRSYRAGGAGADDADEKTREEEINDRKLADSRITNQPITNNSASRYAGGVPDEEMIVFDGQDVSWEEEWKEFIAAIREGREPLGNGQDGLEANRMIEAVYRSARENRAVKIGDLGPG